MDTGVKCEKTIGKFLKVEETAEVVRSSCSFTCGELFCYDSNEVLLVTDTGISES